MIPLKSLEDFKKDRDEWLDLTMRFNKYAVQHKHKMRLAIRAIKSGDSETTTAILQAAIRSKLPK